MRVHNCTRASFKFSLGHLIKRTVANRTKCSFNIIYLDYQTKYMPIIGITLPNHCSPVFEQTQCSFKTRSPPQPGFRRPLVSLGGRSREGGICLGPEAWHPICHRVSVPKSSCVSVHPRGKHPHDPGVVISLQAICNGLVCLKKKKSFKTFYKCSVIIFKKSDFVKALFKKNTKGQFD